MTTAMKFISAERNTASEQKADENLEPGAGQNNQKPGPNYKKLIVMIMALGLLVSASLAGYNWFQTLSTHQETDDAYITGHLHQVSARLPGTVSKVLVDDNEHVKTGQLLIVLDPRDYQVKVTQAKAALATALEQSHVAQTTINYAATNATGQVQKAKGGVSHAQATISQSLAAVSEAQGAVAQANADFGAKQSEYNRAEGDFRRYTKLQSQGVVSVQELDNARRDYEVAERTMQSARDKITQAEAKFKQSQEMVNTAKAQLAEAQGEVVLAQASGAQTKVDERQFVVTRTSIAQAQAALDEAQLNLSYTNIYAPTNGRIGKKTVEVGQRIEPGQPLLTVVSDETWVVANFKETQLKQMRPGDKVEIKIDSFPDHKFSGQVLSFAPGSGASFALLPSDNATGNFTKIVQRVPVKIIFDARSLRGYENLLVPGMSVIASVAVSSHPSASALTIVHAN